MGQQLQVQLLDTFTIVENGQAVTNLGQRERIQSLLGYLILHRGQDIPRSKLAFELWPESTDSQARTNLRRELHYLKRDLPNFEAYLTISNKTMGWNAAAPAEIDVEEFEKALQSAQVAQQSGDAAAHRQALQNAAQLYRGTLLPHLYDEWIPPEQERLQQQAIQGLTTLVESLQTEGEYRAAIRYAQQLLRLDNLNEAAYGSLIQLHALSGDRATALRLYHHCMTLIREELGVDPSASLRSLYEELLNEPEPAIQSESAVKAAPTSSDSAAAESAITESAATRTDWGEATDVSAFYGRQEELQTLRDWVLGDSARGVESGPSGLAGGTQQRCRLIAILGMGGMGKTTLSVKFARQMAETLEGTGASAHGGFDVVIWRSLRYAPTWESLMADLIAVLSNQQETRPTPPRLMHWLRELRCLVVLDNVETILKGGEEAGEYLPGYEAYGDLFRLFAEGAHQSCLVLTSREKPQEVGMFEGADLPVRSLQLKGSPEVVEAIIQTKGLLGTVEQKRQLGERYDNMPLAIKITASSIQELFDGEIEPFLAEDVYIFNGLRRLLNQQFERLSRLERSIMDWLAINREWTSIQTLAEDLRPPVPRSALLAALESLRWRSLIDKRKGHYTQPAAVMELVTEQLVRQVSQELAQAPQETDWFQTRLHTHALCKATAQDFIRDLQRTLLLQPIVQQCQMRGPGDGKITALIREWIKILQTQDSPLPSYAAGNLIHLLVTAQVNLNDWDFSRLSIQQAYLQNVSLHRVNFSQSQFDRSVFATRLSAILDLDWSEDGQLLVTSDVEGSVKLWRAPDRQLLHRFQGHNNWVHTVAFASDGCQLASGGEDATVRVWAVDPDGEMGEVRVLSGHESRVWSVAFQPSGNCLASGSEDGTVRLWHRQIDQKMGQQMEQPLQVLQGHGAGVNAVQWLGEHLISGSADKTLRIWSQAGDCLGVLEGHEHGIWSIAVHPLESGEFLVASGSQDGVIRLWLLPKLEAGTTDDLELPACFATLKTPSRWIWSLRFDKRGRYLVSGHDDGCIYLWKSEIVLEALPDLGVEEMLQEQLKETVQLLKGHESRVWGVAFNPEGDRLVSGGKDQTLHFWDLERCVSLNTLKGYTNWVQAIAFHPQDGTLLGGYEDTVIRRWSPETGESIEMLQGHQQPVWAIAISSDGTRCASSGEDETVRLWPLSNYLPNPDPSENHDSTPSNAAAMTLPGKQGRVWSVSFSPDGQQLAFGRGDHSISLWDLEGERGAAPSLLHQLVGHRDRIWSVTFSPDGQTLASSSSDGTIRLWDVQTGDCLHCLKGHRGWVFCVCWSPDGQRLASSGSDGCLCLWDCQSGERTATIVGKTKLMLSVQFSPDGLHLVSGGDDNAVCLWNVETQTCLHRCQGHQGWVWSVAFSPDGETIASGSQDSAIHLWEAATGQLLQQFRPTRPYEGMNLVGATGLTPGQRDTLQALGGTVS